MTKRSYPIPSAWSTNVPQWVREIRDAVAGLLDGKHNAAGSITLTASSGTSTLSDRRLHEESVITFMPRTANAKTEGSPYVTGRTKGEATLNHTNNAQTDRDYDYMLGGG